jgi:hypothetical protein
MLKYTKGQGGTPWLLVYIDTYFTSAYVKSMLFEASR